jgi:hypothetical protein
MRRLFGKVVSPFLPDGRFRVAAYASLGTSTIEITRRTDSPGV